MIDQLRFDDVQVLPPTDIYSDIPQHYCAHDSHNAGDTSTNTFMSSLHRVGEGLGWYSSPYEMWSQVRGTLASTEASCSGFCEDSAGARTIIGTGTEIAKQWQN